MCEIIEIIEHDFLNHRCTTHIQLSLRSLSRAVNFKQIQPQRPGRFSNALQRRAPIGRWVKDIGVLPNSVAGEERNRLGISP